MGLFGVEKKEKRQEQMAARELPPPPPVTAERGHGAARPAPPPEPPVSYGIDKAIELMRTLPSDDEHLELVVQVIRSTLASTSVSVEAIIDDATRKQERIQRRVARLAEEIVGLEKEIQLRRDETLALQQDHDETTQVKARLSLGLASTVESSEEDGADEDAVPMTPPIGTPIIATT
jgi:hypothetical protein